MNFAALKQELSDRGFSYLSDARLGQYINWARAELDDTALWPYRLKTATDVSAPFVIQDFGVIEYVLDKTTGRTLTPADERDLVEAYGDLSLAGTPRFYYLDNNDGVAVVQVYPQNTTDTMELRYYAVPPDLGSEVDEPESPARWHRVIVDIAVRMAYRDSDNHEAAAALAQQIAGDLWLMLETQLVQQVQGPQSAVQARERW